MLLLVSGVLVLIGRARPACGCRDFFQRMHAPALASTLGSWSVTLASIVHFSRARPGAVAARRG